MTRNSLYNWETQFSDPPPPPLPHLDYQISLYGLICDDESRFGSVPDIVQKLCNHEFTRVQSNLL